MILAGGLGSSAYIRDAIQEHLNNLRHPNARQVIVIPCQEPQLVVVRGLLLEQQQKLETGAPTGVLTNRIARCSYGVVVRQPYTPAYHYNEDVVPDLFDTKHMWAINQIQWLIRKVRAPKAWTSYRYPIDNFKTAFRATPFSQTPP